jgi:hypothetical protein
VGRGDAESAQKIARGHVSRFNKYMEQAARQAVPSGKPSGVPPRQTIQPPSSEKRPPEMC